MSAGRQSEDRTTAFGRGGHQAGDAPIRLANNGFALAVDLPRERASGAAQPDRHTRTGAALVVKCQLVDSVFVGEVEILEFFFGQLIGGVDCHRLKRLAA